MGMGMGNGEWGMGNGEWGMGNGEKDALSYPHSPLPTPHSPLLFPLSSSQAIFGHTKIRVAYFGQSNLKRNFEAGL
jgi:hypothetical protein